MKRTPEDASYTLYVQGSERYSDLAMLQAALLEPLADALAMVIRERMQNGEFPLGNPEA